MASVLLAMSACAPEPEEPPGPPFDAIAFFAGKSHGDAVLRQIFKEDRKVVVNSLGTRRRDGNLVLDQRITVAGEPPRMRRWVLRKAGPGRYSGTLTDATGPVAADQVGGALRIRYAMKSGLKVEQWLVPIAGRSAVANRLTVHKWGLRVALLTETISKP